MRHRPSWPLIEKRLEYRRRLSEFQQKQVALTDDSDFCRLVCIVERNRIDVIETNTPLVIVHADKMSSNIFSQMRAEK